MTISSDDRPAALIEDAVTIGCVCVIALVIAS
jgi:hypothetical protein